MKKYLTADVRRFAQIASAETSVSPRTATANETLLEIEALAGLLPAETSTSKSCVSVTIGPGVHLSDYFHGVKSEQGATQQSASICEICGSYFDFHVTGLRNEAA